MDLFTASMKHNPETLVRLVKTQYNTFFFYRKILQLVCGVILVYLGLTASSSLLGVICLLAGCWMCVSLDEPAKHTARKVIGAMHGQYPKTNYSFRAHHFIIHGSLDSSSVAYNQIIRLIEDEQYCYLYISRMSAYMIDKSTVVSDLEDFRIFLSDSCALRWARPTTLLTFRIPSLFFRRKDAKGRSVR